MLKSLPHFDERLKSVLLRWHNAWTISMLGFRLLWQKHNHLFWSLPCAEAKRWRKWKRGKKRGGAAFRKSLFFLLLLDPRVFIIPCCLLDSMEFYWTFLTLDVTTTKIKKEKMHIFYLVDAYTLFPECIHSLTTNHWPSHHNSYHKSNNSQQELTLVKLFAQNVELSAGSTVREKRIKSISKYKRCWFE